MTEITPETLKNATPDNLKKLARLIRMGQPLQSVAASEAIDLCVAVWAADRKRLEQWEAEAQDKARPQVRPMTVLENAYMDLKGKLGQAEARIEAAEKLMDKVVTEGYGWGGLGFSAWKDDYAKWREVAALAAREKRA